MVTTNLFGDIISDEAAQVTGSLGLAAGANIGDTYAMFEPVHALHQNTLVWTALTLSLRYWRAL
jgi:isocitrate dehydrogenase